MGPGSYNKDYSILGSILGSLILGKLPSVPTTQEWRVSLKAVSDASCVD